MLFSLYVIFKLLNDLLMNRLSSIVVLFSLLNIYILIGFSSDQLLFLLNSSENFGLRTCVKEMFLPLINL